MTCFWHHDVPVTYFWRWDNFLYHDHFWTSWRVLPTFWHHDVFLKSWRTFWHHDVFWCHDELFGVMTCSWRHDEFVYVMTCSWRHDELFDVLTYFWRHYCIMTYLGRHNVTLTSWCNVKTYFLELWRTIYVIIYLWHHDVFFLCHDILLTLLYTFYIMKYLWT